MVASHGTPPPNQAMERTAAWPVFTFEIIKPFSLRATLALGSGPGYLLARKTA
jgi:hypothetical protein